MDDDEDMFDNNSDTLVSGVVQDVKTELNCLRKIEQRRKTVDELFRQVALASRLKAELNVCSIDRSSPVVCSLKLHQPSCGKCFILVNLLNNCKENLVGWHFVVQLHCLRSRLLNFRFNCFQPKLVVCCSQKIPLLKDGCSLDLNVYCQEKLSFPTFVKCYLAKTFHYNRPKIGPERKTFQICVHTSLLTILDLARSKTDASFFPPLFPNLPVEEMDECRYCFALGLVKILTKTTFELNCHNAGEILLNWLFPNVTTITVNIKDETKTKFVDMNFDSNVHFTVTFHSSTKANEIQMLVQLTGCGSEELMKLVKSSILIKYLYVINDTLKVPKNVDIDLSAVTFALDNLRNDATQQQNGGNMLVQLSETVLWKLPLV